VSFIAFSLRRFTDCNKRRNQAKLENLIIDRLNSEKEVYPFGDYFSDENFKQMLDLILYN
jgi:hypothetical protein